MNIETLLILRNLKKQPDKKIKFKDKSLNGEIYIWDCKKGIIVLLDCSANHYLELKVTKLPTKQEEFNLIANTNYEHKLTAIYFPINLTEFLKSKVIIKHTQNNTEKIVEILKN